MSDEDGGKRLRVVGAGRAQADSPVTRYLLQEEQDPSREPDARPRSGDLPTWFADEQPDGELAVTTSGGEAVSDPGFISRVRPAVARFKDPHSLGSDDD